MARRPDLAFRSRTASDSPAAGRSLGGSLAIVALLVAGLLVVSYPVVAVAVPVVAGPVAAAGLSVRHAVARVKQRRRTGQAKKVCVPAAGVCIEA